MKQYHVAILGATGAVGMQMLESLFEQDFPLASLRLLASERSVGKTITMDGKTFTVEAADEHSFEGIDIVLGAAGNDVAKKLIPAAVKAGAVVIDNSSAYRLDEAVPLIIPEVNPEAIHQHHGIIANPNCATIIALVACQPLHAYARIKRMVVSTYQAVSGAGVNGWKELDEQIDAIRHHQAVTCRTFPHQIAFNLIPQIGSFAENGYTAEEMKMQNEGRKIWNQPDLQVNCTCVRVPVYRSHSESIMVELEKPLDVATAKELIAQGQGVKLVDDPNHDVYPMPLATSDQDLVYVGRIRKDLSGHDNALSLWCCGDQIRKGAASNAVQIAKLLIKTR